MRYDIIHVREDLYTGEEYDNYFEPTFTSTTQWKWGWDIQQQYPTATYRMVMGYDMAPGYNDWNLHNFVVNSRDSGASTI
jgi:hypothetical protein